MLTLTDYDYTLPEELIAQHPLLPAEDARLLVYTRETNTLRDHHFYDLPELLPSGTLMVFNNSKVVKARLLFPDLNGEVLFLRLLTSTEFEALVRPGKKRKIWATQTLPGTNITFTVIETTYDGRIVRCSHPVLEVFEQYGQMPLPPYIEYNEQDAPHYQPIVADETKSWSVAAPTAALHFSTSLLDNLEHAWIPRAAVTLHVGIGTFKTVDVEDITAYQIHDEVAEVSMDLFARLATQKSSHQPILAIGTTTTRTLESLPYLRKQISTEQKIAGRDEATRQYRDTLTQDITEQQSKKYVSNIMVDTWRIIFHSTIYIYPWFTFLLIDQLITNFHLPKSSLLMLVAWYIGYDEMKQVYAHAIQEQYRFFSFWDGMLVL